jgi:hypothetical protein
MWINLNSIIADSKAYNQIIREDYRDRIVNVDDEAREAAMGPILDWCNIEDVSSSDSTNTYKSVVARMQSAKDRFTLLVS